MGEDGPVHDAEPRGDSEACGERAERQLAPDETLPPAQDGGER